ncbi:hypothetical protein K440DRAFT_638986 [Wilcoxina mikolae CBS 423.85]|nr:hypothetical protein K440DRAFT_638986 [Wilcoxina mikolae CBS 423.85]
MISRTVHLISMVCLFVSLATSVAIRGYQPIIANTIGVHGTVHKRDDSGPSSLSSFALSAPPVSADNGPAPTLIKLDGEYTYIITCQVTPNAPQSKHLIEAANALKKGPKTCPAYPEKYINKLCVDIIQYGTVDVQLCYAPKTGVDCDVVANATIAVAEECTIGKKSGGWSIVKGPKLGEGVKVFALE